MQNVPTTTHGTTCYPLPADMGKAPTHKGRAYITSSAADSQPVVSRPVSSYQVTTPGELSLNKLCQWCISGEITQIQYEAMQKQLSSFIQQIDNIDIWYNPKNNRLLEAVDRLRPLQGIPFSSLTEAVREELETVVNQLNGSVVQRIQHNLKAESAPILQCLLAAGFTPSEAFLKELLHEPDITPILTLDVFQTLYSNHKHLLLDLNVGLQLLTFRPADIFNDWLSQWPETVGEESDYSLLKEAFWKKWHGDDLYKSLIAASCSHSAILNLITLPTVKATINEEELEDFSINKTLGIESVIKRHQPIFDLLITNMVNHDCVADAFLRVPEKLRPYLLWSMTKEGHFYTVGEIVSAHEKYKKCLLAVDKGSGDSCLHREVYSGQFAGFHALVTGARLQPLLTLANHNGQCPYDLYQADLFISPGHHPADFLKLLKPLDFLLEHLPPESVQNLLERVILNFNGDKNHFLVHIMMYALQKGLAQEPCAELIRTLTNAGKSHGNLKKAYALVSGYLPENERNSEELADKLATANLPSKTILRILSVLPGPFVITVLDRLLAPQEGNHFLQGLSNTGLYPLGGEWDPLLPWSRLLTLVVSKCFQPPKPRAAINDAYQKNIAQYTRHSKGDSDTLPALPDDMLKPFLAPNSEVGVYGRSLFTQLGDSECLRLKLRKRTADSVEPLVELTREAGVLAFLREQQEQFRSSDQGHGLDIRSRLPEPKGNFRILEPDALLSRPATKNARLAANVTRTEATGSLPAYVFMTAPDELYHRYVHEREGTPGLSRDNALKGLRLAAHDIGVLFRNGFSVDNALPIYHNRTLSDTRKYQTLNQLAGYRSQGALMDWNGKATEYPNISPSPVGLRDFAEIRRHDELSPRHNQLYPECAPLMVLGNNMLALELLLARTLQSEFSSRDPEAFRVKAEEVKEELLTLYTTLFGEAFNMPEGSVARQRLRSLLQAEGVADQAAREMVYWCETGDHPGWVDDVKNRRVPAWVYPCPDEQIIKDVKSREEYALLKPKGFMCSTHNPDLNLGKENGLFPLVQSSCMKTLAIAAGIVHAPNSPNLEAKPGGRSASNTVP